MQLQLHLRPVLRPALEATAYRVPYFCAISFDMPHSPSCRSRWWFNAPPSAAASAAQGVATDASFDLCSTSPSREHLCFLRAVVVVLLVLFSVLHFDLLPRQSFSIFAVALKRKMQQQKCSCRRKEMEREREREENSTNKKSLPAFCVETFIQP